jgi:hypothetical protein
MHRVKCADVSLRELKRGLASRTLHGIRVEFSSPAQITFGLGWKVVEANQKAAVNFKHSFYIGVGGYTLQRLQEHNNIRHGRDHDTVQRSLLQ